MKEHDQKLPKVVSPAEWQLEDSPEGWPQTHPYDEVARRVEFSIKVAG